MHTETQSVALSSQPREQAELLDEEDAEIHLDIRGAVKKVELAFAKWLAGFQIIETEITMCPTLMHSLRKYGLLTAR